MNPYKADESRAYSKALRRFLTSERLNRMVDAQKARRIKSCASRRRVLREVAMALGGFLAGALIFALAMLAMFAL